MSDKFILQMKNLTAEQQNRIPLVMRAIQKVVVKKYLKEVMEAADISAGEPHSFEALVTDVRMKCVENGCNFSEVMVSEFILEIVEEFPTPVPTPVGTPRPGSPSPLDVGRDQTLEYGAVVPDHKRKRETSPLDEEVNKETQKRITHKDV